MIELGGRQIGPGQRCFVIAEAGVNHNGDIALACRLVDAAADAGADAVKFQTFRADLITTFDAPKAEYQRHTTAEDQSQHDMLAALELSEEDHVTLIHHCKARRIEFLSSPFDTYSADMLVRLGVPAIKLGSGELTNRPLLQHVAALNLPLLLSTGMSEIDEVRAALEVVHAVGSQRVALLHCVSAYPADPAQANLHAIATLAQAFGLPVGWSDHCFGIEVTLAAVALGACVIEKHITLDRHMPGPDHRASTEPAEFAQMVEMIHEISAALGDGQKRPMPCEVDTRTVARRSIVTAAAIDRGQSLTADLLAALRPAHGICPMRIEELIGRRAARDLPAGHVLHWDDLS